MNNFTQQADNSNGNEHIKKAIHLTTTLQLQHTSLYISLLSLYDFKVKTPHFLLYVGCKQATKIFLQNCLLSVMIIAGT